MILYRAPWYYYVSTTLALLLEIAIIYCSPFLTWALDLNWKAGDTFLSEYSVVIALRWTVVLIFQLPMLFYCFSALISTIQLFIYSLRNVLAIAKKFQNGRNRNPDGSFAPEHDSGNSARRRGRPPKNNTA